MSLVNEQIVFDFLHDLKFKFNILFKNDITHKDLIERVLIENKLSLFVHIVEVCISKIGNSTCKTCSKNEIEKSISYISMYGKNIALFFSSYFNCNLKISLEIFSRFKSAIFTNDGMHLFDHLTSTLSYIKWLNKTESDKNADYDRAWFGGFYFNSEPIESFQTNINFINSEKKFKKIVYFGLLGTTLKPIHFFAIFIDKRINTIFIYNSSPLELKEYKFQKKLSKFNFMTNRYQNQFNNELCGFFSLYFLEKMIKSSNTNECFKTFDKKKNLDKIIERYQKTCIYPVRKNYKLVDFFLNDWDR